MAETAPLYTELVDISRDYLGPAAERFIERQITTHLHKKPSEVNRQDLVKLIDWIKLAFALLTNDSHLVDEYIKRLLVLTRTPSIKATSANA